MFDSLIKDIKYELTRGNSVMRLIFINSILFFVIIVARIILSAFNGGDQIQFDNLIEWFTLPVSFGKLIFQPWSLFTYSFIHFDLWHILLNMLIFYWFGMIVGDLIGYRRIFPIYTIGAIFGGLFAMICLNLLSKSIGSSSHILGASASVMAVIMAAGTLAPDYIIRLLILGNVKIKYIIAVIIVADLLAISLTFNAGGAFAHIGGGLAGYLFIMMLRNGYDPSDWFFGARKRKSKSNKSVKQKARVVHMFDRIKLAETPEVDQSAELNEKRLDEILEKIKKSGRHSLTSEELAFLEKFSNSN